MVSLSLAFRRLDVCKEAIFARRQRDKADLSCCVAICKPSCQKRREKDVACVRRDMGLAAVVAYGSQLPDVGFPLPRLSLRSPRPNRARTSLARSHVRIPPSLFPRPSSLFLPSHLFAALPSWSIGDPLLCSCSPYAHLVPLPPPR